MRNAAAVPEGIEESVNSRITLYGIIALVLYSCLYALHLAAPHFWLSLIPMVVAKIHFRTPFGDAPQYG